MSLFNLHFSSRRFRVAPWAVFGEKKKNKKQNNDQDEIQCSNKIIISQDLKITKGKVQNFHCLVSLYTYTKTNPQHPSNFQNQNRIQIQHPSQFTSTTTTTTTKEFYRTPRIHLTIAIGSVSLIWLHHLALVLEIPLQLHFS